MNMQGICFDDPHLELIPDSNGERHRLIYDWSVLFNGVTYRVPALFVTDGASIPCALRPICGSPYRAPRLYAALIHDYLYSPLNDKSTRAEADALFRDMQIALGISRIKAYVEYSAIRLLGSSHYQGQKP